MTRFERQAQLILVLGFFIVGVFGRFPWKADEPYTFGVIWSMLERGDWIVPHVSDQPFVEKPPFVYWLGAGLARLAPMLPPHEASRLAIIALVGLTLFAMWHTALLLGGEASKLGGEVPEDRAIVSLLLFAGTVGVAEHVHKLTADLGQLAGGTLALWGLVRLHATAPGLPEQPSRERAAAWVGTGAGIAFLSKGLLVPGMVALAWFACALIPGSPAASRRATGWATLAALPWLIVWPALLWRSSPDLFDEWLWANNVDRFLGKGNLGATGTPLGMKVVDLCVMAFPALPLAAAALWRLSREAMLAQPRRGWPGRFPGHACVAAYSGAGLLALLVSGTYRSSYALPVLASLALLGVSAVRLGPRRRSERFLGHLVLTVFGAAVLLVTSASGQLALAASLHPSPWADAAGQVLPLPFDLPVHWSALLAVGVAVGLSLRLSLGTTQGATLAWCRGVVLLWITAFGLLLPWMDAARSYEPVFREVHRRVEPTRCLAVRGLGESEIALLDYVIGGLVKAPGVRVSFENRLPECRWLLEQTRGGERPAAQGQAAWEKVWEGHRPADRFERFHLYRRRAPMSGAEAAP